MELKEWVLPLEDFNALLNSNWQNKQPKNSKDLKDWKDTLNKFGLIEIDKRLQNFFMHAFQVHAKHLPYAGKWPYIEP